MFVSIPGKQTLWTHTSLIEEQKANNIISLVNGVGSFQNKFTLFGTYLSLEAVNRVAPLKKLAFYYRAGVVAGVFLASRIGSVSLYRASIQKQINTLVDGAPVWENKKEVPELDKKFFFLDDDNNFQPSLWHHGMYLTHITQATQSTSHIVSTRMNDDYQKQMNPIDQHKLIFILKDTTQRLYFIGKLQRDNDISSELAGYEQSKLLSDQQQLEQDYATLVGQRSKLLGITNRVQLFATQEEIKKVAKNLKESTKKLCRLFKENPNIDADSQKVYKERAELIYEFETLIQLVQTGQLKEFANKVTASLEQQDSLRKFAAREKELIAEIRRLQNEKTQEYNEYQKEQNEKQKNIQLLKERLLYKTQRAEQQKKYDEKVAGAQENTQQRIFQYKQQDVEAQIAFFTNKIANEELVHKELKIYLDRKTNEAETLTKQQNQLAEDQRVILDEKIEKLTEYKTKMLEELDILKRRFEKEEIEKQERERKELEEREQKIRNELQQIRLENAIKLIQNELMERKELYGLGAKKKKPKKKK